MVVGPPGSQEGRWWLSWGEDPWRQRSVSWGTKEPDSSSVQVAESPKVGCLPMLSPDLLIYQMG